MGRILWRGFAEARAFVRELGLLDQAEWAAYSRGDLIRYCGKRPRDIPSCPFHQYRDLGWKGMRDWLGPPPLAPVEPGYLEFRRARTFARSLGFSAPVQWRAWCRGELPGTRLRLRNVPEEPERMYPRAWRGWADWLGAAGTGRRARAGRFRAFADARAFARSLGLANVKEWRAFCKRSRPADIPANPDTVYRHRGWTGFHDWLGTSVRSAPYSAYLPFEDARAFVQRLGLSGGDDFRAWVCGERPRSPAPPRGMHANPNRIYRDCGWTTWGDFLGTGNIAATRRDFPPFERAREFARGLGLRNHHEWVAFVRGEGPAPLPADMDLPTYPDAAYRRCGWTTWGDFLGTGFVAFTRREFRPFAAARDFAHALRLNSIYEWRAFVRGEFAGLPPFPDDIPVSPDRTYADQGWRGWPDFLGNPGRRRRATRRSFERARELARSLNLRRGADWVDWIHGQRPDLPDPPDDVPVSPGATYRDEGWQGWGDFLGTGTVARHLRTWRPHEEARAFARTLGLGSCAEWAAWGRGSPEAGPRPIDIPAKPHVVYAGKGWRGWPDFLGFEP